MAGPTPWPRQAPARSSWFNDIDEAAAAETASLVAHGGGTAAVEVGAVGGTEIAEALVDRAVADFGRLDAMVTNAWTRMTETIPIYAPVASPAMARPRCGEYGAPRTSPTS